MKKRVISLLPSATEIVCTLGAEDQLVGRSHECDYPDSVRSCRLHCGEVGCERFQQGDRCQVKDLLQQAFPFIASIGTAKTASDRT